MTIRPSLPRRPSLLRHTGHNGNDCKLISSSKFRLGGAAAEEEIAVCVNETPVDGSDEFSLYVAVDADVQTAAEITDVMELWHILP